MNIIKYKNQNFLFIKIPMNGSESILNTFGQESNGYSSIKEFPEKSLVFYISFAFVRNPYNRILDSFIYFNNSKNDLDKIFFNLHLKKYNNNFKKFIKNEFCGKHLDVYESILHQPYFKAQHKFLENEKGLISINFIGKYERLQEDLNKLLNLLQLPNFKPIILKEIKYNNVKDINNYYDKNTRELVYNAYEKDFILFRYSK